MSVVLALSITAWSSDPAWCQDEPSFVAAKGNIASCMNNLGAKEIRDKGYQTYVIKGKTLYKVQVGEFKTSDEAKAISEKLKKLGYEIWVTTR